MQIIITQSEIESAITNFIREQINVREGMRIDVSLFATRGETGFTATIDIVPVNAKPTVAKLTNHVTEIAAPIATVVVSKDEQKKTEPVSQPESVTAPENPAPKLFSHLQPKTANVEAPVEPKQPVVVVPQEVVPKAPSEPPPRSLFASLKKPVNIPEALM